MESRSERKEVVFTLRATVHPTVMDKIAQLSEETGISTGRALVMLIAGLWDTSGVEVLSESTEEVGG